MKIIFINAAIVGFFFLGCEMEKNSEQIKDYQFEAIVMGQGMDCGETYLIDLKKKKGNSVITDGTYYADSLPSNLKVKGLKIDLNCREPNENELYPCTTMGFGYDHIIVTDSELDSMDNNETIDFFKLEDRIGKWINVEREDTLEFLNDKDLQRYYGEKNDYLYRIHDSSLYINLPPSLTETQHEIIETDGNKVKLGNMYIGHEQTVNYGVYVKID